MTDDRLFTIFLAVMAVFAFLGGFLYETRGDVPLAHLAGVVTVIGLFIVIYLRRILSRLDRQ